MPGQRLGMRRETVMEVNKYFENAFFLRRQLLSLAPDQLTQTGEARLASRIRAILAIANEMQGREPDRRTASPASRDAAAPTLATAGDGCHVQRRDVSGCRV